MNWYKSCIANRLQITEPHGVFTNNNLIKYGVPQGSVLGRLLFIL